jgi:hypothetical protein
MRMRSYLGLGASATDGVNPDVLSLDVTALVQGHVLHELSNPTQVSMCISSLAQRPLRKSKASRIKRTFSVLETTVESAAWRSSSVYESLGVEWAENVP